MKISLHWLRDFVKIPENVSPHDLARLFTTHTAEVEHVEYLGAAFEKIVVGQILEIHLHPNADKLRITKTSVGRETLQIVCGASNIREGMYVPVALVGSRVRWHGEGDMITLQPAKIRGIESFGMICAGEEIGLEEKSDGVYDLSPLKPKIGASLADVLGKNDIVFTLDNKSLTHRPDLWGHYGIAREIAALLGVEMQPLKTAVQYPKSGGAFPVQVKVPKLCSKYIAVILDNIQVQPSPPWLQQRLKAIGYRSINTVVDAANYVMAELGQPLHAFDLDALDGGIIVRTANEGEELITLDGVKRKLSDDTVVIADAKKVLAIAGVMGGAQSEIQQSSKRILIEAATFSPSSIRKTSVKLGLRTEAVQRFEKSLDPHLASVAADRMIELLLKLCPEARIEGSKIDISNFEEKKVIITLNKVRLEAKIGTVLQMEEIIRILKSLEFIVSASDQNTVTVEVPSFRASKDIAIEEDIVEEIARMYGYENIPAVFPDMPVRLPRENKERRLKHKVREILSLGMAFSEVYNYSFYSLKDIRASLLPEELHLRLKNYLSEDQTHLRISLVPNILKNIAHNKKIFPEFRLFEIGRTYEDLQEYFPQEKKKICAVLVKNRKYPKEIFYDAKGALQTFFAALQLQDCVEFENGTSLCPYAHPQKYASCVDKKHGVEIARVFEIHPFVAKNYGLEDLKIAAFEVDFDVISKLYTSEKNYKAIPKFPHIEIDISVVLDKKILIGDIQKQIQNAEKTLIRDVRLFDLYEGSNIPLGKKAAAFKIILQAEDRTLTDEEMKKVQHEIFQRLLGMGGEIRGLS